MTTEPISQTILATRKRLKLSQDRMATALGISKRSLCYYEAGQIIPPPESTVVTREGILAKLETLERAANLKP